jgi:hypothetical protein
MVPRGLEPNCGCNKQKDHKVACLFDQQPWAHPQTYPKSNTRDDHSSTPMHLLRRPPSPSYPPRCLHLLHILANYAQDPVAPCLRRASPKLMTGCHSPTPIPRQLLRRPHLFCGAKTKWPFLHIPTPPSYPCAYGFRATQAYV